MEPSGFTNRLIAFCLQNRLVVVLLLILGIGAGIVVAPFRWDVPGMMRAPVAVDAIPDIGENQQIVFTEWMGRSPQDVEDQITYPLTTALLGLPEVKTVRSYSFFGFSAIYLIFEDGVEFYWSRSRILEKLNSLPAGTLPDGVTAQLGPDATALGQVFWYTLEGRDENGRPAPGWTPQELRSIQDYQVRYALQSVSGVAEVASIGGFVREYQIDVDPDAMRAWGVTLDEVFRAVKESNSDVGARTIEFNRVEYVIRSRGFVKDLEDLRKTVVAVRDNVPVTLEQIGTVQQGPALRRGALDKDGAEAVGGVVVARYGANPMATIDAVKERLNSLGPSLPSKELEDGRTSHVTVVPFYDRTGLINETLQTLNSALTDEILVTIIVVLLLVFHLRSALLISLMLPLAVLFAFVAMKLFHVDANIVALSGIAIAIGTIVDMGIVICESIIKRLDDPRFSGESTRETIYQASAEVGSAVLTAVLTTVIGFLPVFFMTGPEGKLFKPLAYTKTFALIGSILVALTVLPALATFLFRRSRKPETESARNDVALTTGGLATLRQHLRVDGPRFWLTIAISFLVTVFLSQKWAPLGPTASIGNALLVVALLGALIGIAWAFMAWYPRMLAFFLRAKLLLTALVVLVIGAGIWQWSRMGREFMPSLDEGSFLWMPSTMPHASIGEALEVLELQDQAIRAIPEVENVVGKIGRVDSPLDPAPVSMIETIVTFLPEYRVDENGNRVRQWRDQIQSPDDIWNAIASAAEIPGVTSAPKLQPIETRLVMLQTGMRAPMGLKVYGPDLDTIEKAGFEIERLLKKVSGIRPETVFADRMVGKPYLEIDIDRDAIARYGLAVRDVQDVIETALGGKPITRTVEGRERYSVRVRYQRELRDSLEDLSEILVPTPTGAQIPLGQLAMIEYVKGPQAIKSEKGFLVGYVIFDKQPGASEVEVVETARDFLGENYDRPAGIDYEFTGSYQNQVHAARTLALVVPVALVLIFILLYLHFQSLSLTLMVFLAGIPTSLAGGFILLGLFGQPWFLDLHLFGIDWRQLFQVHPINLSIAVWVGFLALFGIATDDGVLMGTILQQRFGDPSQKTDSIAAIRETTLEAATLRNRPAVMTTATTLLALLPVLTSTGRGADVMVPMAIPTFGGMVAAILTVFVVPTLYCWQAERRLSN
ncbi:MAG: efflux RND transporter permease subunit [Verrucomicrobiae bacterium]|nr:efflux RND transporter permease subunit [Verrucomicrobiae bacterium]